MRQVIKILALFFSTATAHAADIVFTPVDGTTLGLTPAMAAWQEEERVLQGYPPGTQFGNTWWMWSVKIVDQNHDSKMDLLVTSHTKPGGALFRNVTPQQYPASPSDVRFADATGLVGRTHRDMPREYAPLMGDFDNDGRGYDLLKLEGPGHIRNTGLALELKPQVQSPWQGVCHFSTWGALWWNDSDPHGFQRFHKMKRSWGKTYWQTQQSDWYLGAAATGRWTNSETPIYMPGLPQSVQERLDALAGDTNTQNRYNGPMFYRCDLDGDGDEDCVVQYTGSYSSSATYRWSAYCLLNNSTGELEDKTADIGLPGDHYCPVLPLKDYNSDGKLDVMVAYGPASGSPPDTQAGLWLQRADGTFINHDPAPTTTSKTIRKFLGGDGKAAPYIPTVHMLDLNGDGVNDLIISLMRLKKLWVFERAVDNLYVFRKAITHWDADGWDLGDIDNDGRTDIVVGGSGSDAAPGLFDANITVFFNTTPQP